MEIQDRYIKKLLERIDELENATDSFFNNSLSKDEYYGRVKFLIGYIQVLRELDDM